MFGCRCRRVCRFSLFSPRHKCVYLEAQLLQQRRSETSSVSFTAPDEYHHALRTQRYGLLLVTRRPLSGCGCHGRGLQSDGREGMSISEGPCSDHHARTGRCCPARGLHSAGGVLFLTSAAGCGAAVVVRDHLQRVRCCISVLDHLLQAVWLH